MLARACTRLPAARFAPYGSGRAGQNLKSLRASCSAGARAPGAALHGARPSRIHGIRPPVAMLAAMNATYTPICHISLAVHLVCGSRYSGAQPIFFVLGGVVFFYGVKEGRRERGRWFGGQRCAP
jgi:hypothetical protein